MESQAKVAVIGAGYWGKNLVRNFHNLKALACICDTRGEVLKQLGSEYDVRTCSDRQAILTDDAIGGVVVATPAADHYDTVRQCLKHGKDVYVEKPLALRVEEGRELVNLAAGGNRILMVGHILEYHPAINALKKLVSSGELGHIQYIFSSRLNLGKLRTEENILWSFAPHDISAILSLLGEQPVRVSTQGGSYLNAQIPDTTLTSCEFKSGVKAHIFVSWLHPFKEQKLTVVGGKKMAVFDDMERERKLVLYAHRIDWVDRVPIAQKAEGEVIPVPQEEPLRAECEHFLECMRTRQLPRTSGAKALRVLEVLEACERSLKQMGMPVDVEISRPNYDAHSTAVIDPGCEIGAGTKIWHFSHIMSGSKLGARCNLGQNVVISPGVTIGNNVKIQNNVSVYTGVELEDNVFCGPSMVFTNVINPRSHVTRKHEYRRTLIRSGASIGANATVVCGVTMGRYSFAGAGAVITRDVPDYALVVGVPAQQIGWVCACGTRLLRDSGEAICTECKRRYEIHDGTCREILPAQLPHPEFAMAASAASLLY
ncbi:MAG TPA: Gfo/Idh/MocA family oxidoreductase [Terriglobales bacterium]|nr:Gfo/Idh/MocA family oxidoreductase [Terriglobales bacterium]